MSVMSSSRHTLFADLDVSVEIDAPIGAMTWFGVGGRADFLVRPRSVEALSTLARRCAHSSVPLRTLGSGANLLVADEGVDGVVVRLDEPCFTGVDYNATGPVEAVRAHAGADLMKLVVDSAKRGLDGLWHLGGIPASVGGAVRMNAGGAFGDIAQSVHSVCAMSRHGELSVHPAAELGFDYRRSLLPPDSIVIWAALALTPSDPERIRVQLRDVFAYKKRTQPMSDHSAGCMFRNPTDPSTAQRISAGKLIDEAGLKGTAEGGAFVSPRHGNFIGVHPGATASDVLRLVDRIRSQVHGRSGIRLEREVVVWSRHEVMP
jgi:UDP-N-acetylmuramate dehydrogenase